MVTVRIISKLEISIQNQVNSVGVRHVELFRDLLNYNITMSLVLVIQPIMLAYSFKRKGTIHLGLRLLLI